LGKVAWHGKVTTETTVQLTAKALSWTFFRVLLTGVSGTLIKKSKNIKNCLENINCYFLPLIITLLFNKILFLLDA